MGEVKKSVKAENPRWLSLPTADNRMVTAMT
jgi:hypothetical protein